MRATAARIDALEDEPERAHETAAALARETAALTQAIEGARGALAKAADVAARQAVLPSLRTNHPTRIVCRLNAGLGLIRDAWTILAAQSAASSRNRTSVH